MCLDAKLVLIAGKPLSEILLLEVFFVLLPLWPRCHDVDFIQEYLDLPLILKGFVHWATPWPPSASSNCTVQQLFVFFSISLWIHEQQSDKFDVIMNDYFWVVIRFSKFQSFIHKIYLLIFQFFPLLFLTFFSMFKGFWKEQLWAVVYQFCKWNSAVFLQPVCLQDGTSESDI